MPSSSVLYRHTANEMTTTSATSVNTRTEPLTPNIIESSLLDKSSSESVGEATDTIDEADGVTDGIVVGVEVTADEKYRIRGVKESLFIMLLLSIP